MTEESPKQRAEKCLAEINEILRIRGCSITAILKHEQIGNSPSKELTTATWVVVALEQHDG